MDAVVPHHPAHGTCRWLRRGSPGAPDLLEINGTPYTVRPLAPGRYQVGAYVVALDTDQLCTCAWYKYHRACKHLNALAAALATFQKGTSWRP